jgi:hypothetical protein
MSKNEQKWPVFVKKYNNFNKAILHIKLINIHIYEENLRDMYKKMKI